MPGHDDHGVLLSGPGVPCAFPELGVRATQDRCAKGERCCVTFPPDQASAPDEKVSAVCEPWSPKSDREGRYCSGWALACDEASDCGAGEVCCGWGGDNPLHAECTKASACEGTVLCVPGGACPDHQVCVGPWLPFAETHRCAAPAKTGAFECLSRSDCAILNQRCCGSEERSACNGHCGGYFPGTETFCRSDAECERGKKCVPAPFGPPTLRRCE